MAVDPKSEQGQALRKLFPLETMPARQYNALCSEINITEKSKGNFLFKQGDEPDSFIYLLQGTISLEAEEFKIETIRGGTDLAKFAIAHQFPRQISARAMGNIQYVSLQLNAFDKQDAEDIEEESTYMVENEGGSENELSEDWMSVLLKSPIFQRLPPISLQQVLINLEDIEFKKGDIIFHQGDAGDYYYLIKQGHCALSRKASKRGKAIKLLELRNNHTFGEDSLLSDEPRSMTVTAMTDMLLSRINKERFIKFIKDPAISYVGYQQLLDDCEQGNAIAIDIRSSDAYKENHIEGCRNIPFFSLRMHLKELSNEGKKIIIICEEGKISKAAAFVLIKKGIDADVLEGGMLSIPVELNSSGKATFPTDVIDDAENSNTTLSEELSLMAEEQVESHAPTPNADAGLEQENQNLKAENKYLTMELENVKKQYKLLYTQSEKLKTALDKLKA